MTAGDEVWRFATTQLDYWELLAAPDLPSEVKDLEGDDRVAFAAARTEVHERIESLVRACWQELGNRATTPHRFNTKHQRRIILHQRSGVALPNKRGWLELSIDEGDDDRLNLWATLTVAKKRMSAVQAYFPDADGFDEASCWYAVVLEPDLADADMAVTFIDAFWGPLKQWMEASDKELDAA